jgi:hypothetical protein
MYPRYPGHRHWSAVEQIQTLLSLPQMTPEEFLACWDVTYSQLSLICFCSESTVKRWFSGRSSPTPLHKFWLAQTHKLWSQL